MKKIPAAGLVYGEEEHHLDHIAPLCLILKIPLIVTEPNLKALAEKYYPNISCHYLSYPEIGQQVLLNYVVVFSSLPRDLFDQIFSLAESMVGKTLLPIWCPHGNSDKGHKAPFFEGLYREKIALVYGQKMIDTMVKKGVYSHLYKAVELGNYRYELYKYLAPFYAPLVEKEVISHLVSQNLSLLYAPTWNDQEGSTSFFDALPILLRTIPDHWNLIVKPHPNLLKQPLKIAPLVEMVKEKPNVCFLESFPPIYPLLDKVDAYLGDMSSIGYDCLPFEKPLFFLNNRQMDPKQDLSLYLSRCGKIIEPRNFKTIFSIIENNFMNHNKIFRKNYKKVNHYVFGNQKHLNQLREEIESTYANYLRVSMASA